MMLFDPLVPAFLALAGLAMLLIIELSPAAKPFRQTMAELDQKAKANTEYRKFREQVITDEKIEALEADIAEPIDRGPWLDDPDWTNAPNRKDTDQ